MVWVGIQAYRFPNSVGQFHHLQGAPVYGDLIKQEARPLNLVSFVGITHFAKLSTHFLSQPLQSQKRHIEIKWVSFTQLQLLAFLLLQGINQQKVSKQWHRHLISFLLLESSPAFFFFFNLSQLLGGEHKIVIKSFLYSHLAFTDLTTFFSTWNTNNTKICLYIVLNLKFFFYGFFKRIQLYQLIDSIQ